MLEGREAHFLTIEKVNKEVKKRLVLLHFSHDNKLFTYVEKFRVM